jgi:hypothetical protein
MIFSGHLDEPMPKKACEVMGVPKGTTLRDALKAPQQKARLSSWERFMRALVVLPDLRA